MHLHNIHSHPRVGYIAYIFVGCEPYTSMLSYVLKFLKLVGLLGYQFAAPSDTIPLRWTEVGPQLDSVTVGSVQ